MNRIEYPWYLKIVPTSILWAASIIEIDDEPRYRVDDEKMNKFVQKYFGFTCYRPYENANLSVDGKSFDLVKSVDSRSCVLKRDKDAYRVYSYVSWPTISNDEALRFSDDIKTKLNDDIPLNAKETRYSIDGEEVYRWISFNNEGGSLAIDLDSLAASNYLIDNFGEYVAVAAGTTLINTQNYIETSREIGADGEELDVDSALGEIKIYILGEIEVDKAVNIGYVFLQRKLWR